MSRKEKKEVKKTLRQEFIEIYGGGRCTVNIDFGENENRTDINSFMTNKAKRQLIREITFYSNRIMRILEREWIKQKLYEMEVTGNGNTSKEEF